MSFSVLDDVGHAFGPESREIEDVLRQLDVTLGTLIAHLDAKVGRANYVLALSADHGVAPIPVPPRGGRIATDDVRERIEDALVTAWGPLQKGSYVEAVNFTDVYFADGVFDKLRANATADGVGDSRRRGDSGRVACAARRSTVGHAAAIRSCAGGAQLHEQPQRRSDDRPEGILVPRSAAPCIGTTHGSHHTYDTHVPVIFFGGAVKAGRSKASVTPADIAPTLADRWPACGCRRPRDTR